jgi:hydrogenase-4 component B
MNLMGGLATGMPRAALLFLVGAVAICGIPPLNGFISEFLLYLGFFAQLKASTLTFLVLLAPLLALVGGLAAIAFSKLYSAVFLGSARSPGAAHPHEPGLTMLLPMALFALLCLVVGLLPQFALQLVTPALAAFMPAQAVAVDPSVYSHILGKISLFGVILLLAVIMVLFFWRWRLRQAPVSQGPTWGCGYLRPSARIQYTATAFSESAVTVFSGIIHQRIERPRLADSFPRPARCVDLPTETCLSWVIAPLFRVAGVSFAFLRGVQHGQMHLYMLYIFVTLFILMLWAH